MKIALPSLGNFQHIFSRISTKVEIPRWLKWTIAGSITIIGGSVLTWSLFASKPPKFIQPKIIQGEGKTRLPHPQEVIAVLNRMAYERDLRHLEFETHNSLSGSEVLIRAALESNAQTVLKRMLTQFYKQYQTAIPITTEISTSNNLLPFSISEVITGAMASIVTSEGERVFIGDRIHGYQLTRIEPGKLVFVGSHRIELAW